MSANDLVMQRLTDSLAQLHTEIVRARQEANHRMAQEYTGVDETGYTPSGSNTTPPSLMSGPVMLTNIVVQCGVPAFLQLHGPSDPNKMLLPSGVTPLSPVKLLCRAGERPYLSTADGSSSSLFIWVTGYEVPSQAEPL